MRYQEGDEGQFGCAQTFSGQNGSIVSIDYHPAGFGFITSASDGTWSLYDIQTSTCVTSVKEASGSSFTSATLHPDGLLYGTGSSDSAIKIWDIRSKKDVVAFEEHQGQVNGMAFSENGYLLASVAKEGAKIWDLRKMKCVKDIAIESSGGGTIISFDYSGLYLAIGGPDSLKVVAPKQSYEVLLDVTADLPKGGLSAMVWDSDAKGLYLGGSKDHCVKCWS